MSRPMSRPTPRPRKRTVVTSRTAHRLHMRFCASVRNRLMGMGHSPNECWDPTLIRQAIRMRLTPTATARMLAYLSHDRTQAA